MVRESTFGEFLRRQRIARGLTQEDLAARAQLSPRAISDLERGIKRAPRWTTVRLLAVGLELTETETDELRAAARPAQVRIAPATVHVTRTYLPAEASTFVGREWELNALPDQLRGSRVVTLVGAGGVGKTRLALRLAQEVEANFPHGARLVELAPFGEPRLLLQAVANVLGVREDPDLPVIESVKAHLGDKQLLLVLDNCEHLVESCAGLVTDLVRACPQLHVLSTSREPLNIAGEMVWRVATLGTPPGVNLSPAQLDEYEAVQLFVARAREAQPGFCLTDANAAAVAGICRRLDGLPLAIELAAARLSVLGVNQIADRLDDRLRLLSRGRRAAPARQQTLRATFDWSYGLLSDAEKILLQLVSVFAGRFSLEAAEYVADKERIDCPDVLEVLSQLVGKSLVAAEPEADGTFRYTLHQALREYALERLAANGRLEAARRLHASYFLELVEPAELALRGNDENRWLRQLEREHDNLWAALSWVLEYDEMELGYRFAAALWRFWDYRGMLADGDDWLRRLLNMPGPDSGVRRRAMLGAGRLAVLRGDSARARDIFERLQQLAEVSDDQDMLSAALHQLGNLARTAGDLPQARALIAQALEIRRAIGFQWGAAISLEVLGSLALREGDVDGARKLVEEALEIRRALAGPTMIADTLSTLALIDVTAGHLEPARRHLEEALRAFIEVQNPRGTARALQDIAELCVRESDPELALRLLGAAAAARQAFGFGTDVFHNASAETEKVARGAVSESVADTAWSAGLAMPTETAIALALEYVGSTSQANVRGVSETEG